MDNSILLTNRIGGFALISKSPASRFEGVFYNDDKLIKVLEDIRVKGRSADDMHYHLWKGERRYQGQTEHFFIPMHHNVIVYELEHEDKFDLIVDVKEIFDDRVWGRNYEIYEEDNFLIIKFTKKTDRREDSTDGEWEYELFIVLRKCNYRVNDLWEEREYAVDKKRKADPYRRFVYNAIEISGKDAIISYGHDLKKAKEELLNVESELKAQKDLAKDHASKLMQESITVDREKNIALNCSINAMDNLVVKEKGKIGIYAGLPWFHQFWARDELISTGSLITLKRFGAASAIIQRYIDSIQDDGRIPNRTPYSEVESADGILWLVHRFGQLLQELETMDLREQYFPSPKLQENINKIEIGINNLMRNHTKDQFALNGPKETWIDTTWKNQDKRSGIRIEMQALLLSTYNFLFRYTNNYKYRRCEEDLRNQVRLKMYKGGRLADGLDDWTIRPNIFIAAYVYPELLSAAEWKECFSNALDKLWLGWGGLTTIDKENPLYTPNYTGQDNQSYHRGDSWYFLNCMAAIAMHRVDKFEFLPYIDKIISACVNQILYHGTIGYLAELSSASDMRSEGCYAQAWSTAMFIELIKETRVSKLIQI